MAEPGPPRTVRVTVGLPIKVWEHITRLAGEMRCSKTEILRRGVSMEAWWRQVQEAGAEIWEEHPDGSRVRVRFPW